MSGIVGSRLNNRGSGLIGSLGTDGQVLTSSGAGKSAVFEAGAIDDNAVTLAKMAGLARGKLIYGDTSGDPAALDVGGADEVLTHDGTDFDWAAAGGGGVNTPLFRANISGQTISVGVNTKIEFDTCSGITGVLNFINGGTYDTSNYKWTPGEAGYYCLTASLFAYTNTAFDQLSVKIQVNGVGTAIQSLFYHKSYGNCTTTSIIYLEATDYVSAQVLQSSGADMPIATWQNGTFFCGHKLIS